MKYINLTQGKQTIVDNEDFERVNKYKWCADKSGGRWYAHRKVRILKKDKKIYLHRFILNIESKLEVDHINGDGLDNRKENLRVSTHRQNILNTKRRIDNTSGYKGVSWDKKRGKYRAYIRPLGKQKFLGYFNTSQEAHEVYKKSALEIFGEFYHP